MYPRPVRHGAVGWTRYMREPPARGRPFIRSNSSRSSARLTMVKAAILQVRYRYSHCLLHLSHCLHLEQGSNHEVSARLPHVQGTGRSNTDFAVHRFTLCTDSDQFNSLSRSSDTCIDMSWTDKAAFFEAQVMCESVAKSCLPMPQLPFIVSSPLFPTLSLPCKMAGHQLYDMMHSLLQSIAAGTVSPDDAAHEPRTFTQPTNHALCTVFHDAPWWPPELW